MNLVVIEGKKAYRYDGKRRIEEADADINAEDITIAEFKAAIEDFRRNGHPPPVIQPADLAFNRLAVELQTKRPIEGLSDDELLTMWDKQYAVKPPYDLDDIRAEIDRRGLNMSRG